MNNLETFESIVKETIKIEGGYVNNPHDLGGETRYGISKRRFPKEDIKNLTKQRAAGLYRIHYWNRYRVEKMIGRLRFIYFDMLVNMGPFRAAKLIQQAVNSKYPNKLKEDGRVGPKTRSAAKMIEVDRIRAFRVLFYAGRTIRKPSQKVFWVGWFRRALKV